jgi:hypothetical protein
VVQAGVDRRPCRTPDEPAHGPLILSRMRGLLRTVPFISPSPCESTTRPRGSFASEIP